MSIKILKPGLLTSLQDLGRHGQMNNGIAVSGAMDPDSLKLANWLVGNPLDKPAIEVTIIGPKIQFNCNLSIAICGADFDLFLNDDLAFTNQTIQIKKGDIIEFDRLNSGARAYIALSADFDFAPVLNSYSTNLTASFGGFNGRELAINDVIPLKNTRVMPDRKLTEKQHFTFSGNYFLRCVSSVESDSFNQTDSDSFYSSQFSVTPDSNRMGIRLKGANITESHIPQIVSTGLTQGSIQITPSGVPIISSVDGQTIGGYPRIANIISADLPLLGQIKAGDKLRFCYLSVDMALESLRQKTAMFNNIFGI